MRQLIVSFFSTVSVGFGVTSLTSLSSGVLFVGFNILKPINPPRPAIININTIITTTNKPFFFGFCGVTGASAGAGVTGV